MNFIIYTSIFTTIGVAILSYFQKSNDRWLSWIKLYCLINVLIEITSKFLAEYGVKNIFLYYILIWVELFFIIQFFYCHSVTIQKFNKLWFYLIIYIILSFILIFFDTSNEFKPYSGIFGGLIIFLFCLTALVDEIKNPALSNFLKKPVFWFISAFLVYYGCTWVILLGTQLFTIKPELFIYIWDGHNILNILKNILIVIGLLWIR